MSRNSKVLGLIVLSINTISCNKETEPVPVQEISILDSATIETGTTEHTNCPAEMVYVKGTYCPQLYHKCEKWLDPVGSIIRRCGTFAKDPICSSPKKEMEVCIDKYEFSFPGDEYPITGLNWYEARKACTDIGKRLCTHEEWAMSCEGPDWLPYPYGYTRDATICNIDRSPLLDSEGKLLDLRAKHKDFPKCVSPYGLFNTTGNASEWTTDYNQPYPWRSVGKGGWWSAVRNNCRAVGGGHDERYEDIQMGTRCCQDPKL